MGRSNLTPQEKELKIQISNKLNALLTKANLKKIDVYNATKISKTTVYDYFSGRTLPSPENVEKLASFFHVDKSDIDPRYSKSPSSSNETKSEADLDKMLDEARSFDGKPMDDHDRELIRNILKGIYNSKNRG